MKMLNFMTVNNTNTKVLCLGAHAPKAYSSLFVCVCARVSVRRLFYKNGKELNAGKYNKGVTP